MATGAELYVGLFEPLGEGAYSFTGALYNNIADVSGNGAYDAVPGMVLFVGATSTLTGVPLPGVVHRYKLTSVTVVDPSTIDGQIVWDETGPEQDMPTNGSFCLLGSVTPKHGLAVVPPDVLYPSMTPGTTEAAMQVELQRIDDIGGTGGASVLEFKFTNVEDWVITHNRGTKIFSTTLRDQEGDRFYAAEHIIDNNSFVVHCSEPSSGSVIVVFP